MYVKQVFIYNARTADEILVEGRVVKPRHVDPQGVSKALGALNVSFQQDFEQAKAAGVLERIDSVFFNADDYRGSRGAPQIFPVLGRKSVMIEIR